FRRCRSRAGHRRSRRWRSSTTGAGRASRGPRRRAPGSNCRRGSRWTPPPGRGGTPVPGTLAFALAIGLCLRERLTVVAELLQLGADHGGLHAVLEREFLQGVVVRPIELALAHVRAVLDQSGPLLFVSAVVVGDELLQVGDDARLRLLR